MLFLEFFYGFLLRVYFFLLRKNPVTNKIPSTIKSIPPIILRSTYKPSINKMIPRIVKSFSSVLDNSHRTQILLPSSLLSLSKSFAKAFAFISIAFFFTGAFLRGFFVDITHIGKGIKG
jgi:hypothetical protein